MHLKNLSIHLLPFILLLTNKPALANSLNYPDGFISTAGMTLSPLFTYSWTADLSRPSNSDERKIIYSAQSDALAYIASEGEIHGVFLESAFAMLKEKGFRGHNMTLARYILDCTS